MQLFQGEPRWIWGEETRKTNRYARFVRSVNVTGNAQDAVLKITADARYEVWINGNWIGNGPPRAWPAHWTLDQYDVSQHLREGNNVVAVRVHHFGTGTFQYLHNPAGLLCELTWNDAAGAQDVVTDESWIWRDDKRFAQYVPRISCQQGWEEQFDARLEISDWPLDFNEAGWKNALILSEAPHPHLEARDIALLSQEPLKPTRFLGAEVVKPADYSWSLQVRELLNPVDKTANVLRGRAFVATHIWSPVDQSIELHSPHYHQPWKLNGEELSFEAAFPQPTDSGIARAQLRAGWNELLGKMPEGAHQWAVVLNIWAEQKVVFAAKASETAPNLESEDKTPWLFLGPFEQPVSNAPTNRRSRSRAVDAHEVHPDATAQRFHDIWERGTLAPEDIGAPWTRAVPPETVCETDVFVLCTSERVVSGSEALVEGAEHLTGGGDGWTTIYPSQDGDVRLLLDWGDEVVAPLEWGIEAPEGTVLDWHFFEFIQLDGRINLCEGMNNSLRYICREGRQHYRTFSRHGFRYAWLSFRDFDQPIKIWGVKAIMNAIPQTGMGAFECDDELLNSIWHVGAHSVQCCAEDTYTDCPSYEQTHWVGDARNEALVDWVVNGDARLSQHSWLQAARSLERSPIVESQVPSAWEIILPAWTFLWMRWAREIWEWSGDADFARRALPYLERNAEGIAGYLDDNGLFSIHAWNMFDWAPMDTPGNGTVTHQSCLAVLGLRETAQMAREIGETAIAQKWLDMAQSLSDAVNRVLWSEEKGGYVDCLRFDGTLSPVMSQQTQTAAFISGVASDHSLERAALCRAALEKAPAGWVEAGSPFFMFFVLEALAREERGTDLLDTIRDYWGRQIKAGATTFWETYYPPSHFEHSSEPINGASLHRLTRSHCHGWSAAPTFFLSAHLLGVQSGGPEFSSVVIAPFESDLKWCKGAVPTPHGVVEVSWKNEEGAPFELEARIPEGLPYQIKLPREGKATVNGIVVESMV